jgi:predicted phage baseplate assembly protein
VFGDGREGSRLPTGTLNVTATYRSGLGRAGNVRAGQIQQLVTRPLGVKEVVNPLRATGGADPETRDQTRRNAPLATAALGRVVAPADYADFARTFAGIAMADAVEISDGRRSVIHVTVAGLDDAPLDPGTELLVALRKAYRQLGDPFQAVEVAPRELLILVVEAKLRIDPERRWEAVAAAVRRSLLDSFGFERRTLGAGVANSEILNAIQSVEGVAMVDLEVFGAIPAATTGSDGVRRPLTPGETEAAIKSVDDSGVAAKVEARRARLEGGLILPAELLLLSPEISATLVLNQVGGEG